MSTHVLIRAVGIAALLFSECASAQVSALPSGCRAAEKDLVKTVVKVAELPYPGIQLNMRTPMAPALLPSGGRNYLVYELHLQNFATAAVTLQGIEISSADGGVERPIALLKENDLNTVLRPVGKESAADNRRLEGGQAVVAFLCVAFDGKAPRQLRHRAIGEQFAIEGPLVAVRDAVLPVLGPPLTGADWNPRNGPHIGSHHRMGIFVADGEVTISRRYAIDWRRSRNGQAYSGNPRDPRAYYAYGEKVLAVASGTVVFARDGMPDNIPKTDAGFDLAVPVTIDTIAGNTVVIDFGNGQLASYAHMQPGSVLVKTGDKVRRGQLVGRVGNSGDARWPHLHFQVSNRINAFAGEGAPFVIDRYRSKAPGGEWQTRSRDFPWGDTLNVDFGPQAAAAN
jgi:murein DD-endopeptidase MepM/ murein hydrolase activator NlpD